MLKIYSCSGIFWVTETQLALIMTHYAVIVKRKINKTDVVARTLLGIVNLDGSAAPKVHQQIAGKQRFYKEVEVMRHKKDIIKARDNRVTQWICKLSKSLYCVTLDGRKLST